MNVGIFSIRPVVTVERHCCWPRRSTRAAAAAGEEKRKRGENRTERDTHKIKMKVKQQQRQCVNRVCVAREFPLHNTEWQCNLIYASNLMCLERIITSIQCFNLLYDAVDISEQRDNLTGWEGLSWQLLFISMKRSTFLTAHSVILFCVI